MAMRNIFVIGAVAVALEMFAGVATYPFSWYAGPTVANFPAPMTLRAGENGFSYEGFAAADGSDLRVKDAEGNLLPHEIERWDPSGYSIVWVKLPSISPAATVTLSWGDSTAAASADSVWAISSRSHAVTVPPGEISRRKSYPVRTRGDEDMRCRKAYSRMALLVRWGVVQRVTFRAAFLPAGFFTR